MEDCFEFDAFISYSHKDMSWGVWLQKKLENRRIPREVREVGGITGKRLKIFRDQTDLAGVELQGTIQKELRLSRYLIVICSPNSAVSPWVAAEIAYFKSLGREENILPFIVEGEPETDRAELECYSPELRNVPDKHYLGANVRELGKNKACLRILSVLTDIRFNRLVDRDRKRRIIKGTVAGGLTFIIIAVTAVLLWRNVKTENEKRLLLYGDAVTAYAQTGKVTPEMVEMLRLSAGAGEAQSCLLLGDFYQNGIGVAADAGTAFSWYESAARLGNTDGIVAVGNCFANGTGTEKDPVRAFQYYSDAAAQGNPSGMFGAALCLRYGEGTEKDGEKALELFTQAAEAGHTLAMKAVAYSYLSGEGAEADHGKALQWTEKLAATGDTSGMYNLASMYRNGWGTEEDPAQALRWYRIAAEAGDADAMFMVGWCLENGYGTEGPALDWYLRAAEAGNSAAAEAVERMRKEQE